MSSDCDPAVMTAEERLWEVAFLLAAGYLRLALSRRNALDHVHPPEALCVHAVNAPGCEPGQERA